MAQNTKILDDLGDKAQVLRSSRQKPSEKQFFTSVYNWVKKMEMQEPDWGYTRAEWVDNRDRDKWLLAMARAEPHLGSVLSTAVIMDANRQWRLIGGRNQVMRFSRRFQEFDNGLGFRTLQEFNATNYYATDVGAVVEIETDRRNGPLQSLYHVDSTRLRLGKKRLIKYDKDDIWKPDIYYRLASQKSPQDDYNQLGYCAVSRCIKLAQTMLAIVEHNLEKLGHIAPKGILFVQAEDLTQEVWDEAMEARKAVYITGTGNEYYDQVVTIVDRAAKGELLALSQLPDGFDTFMFTDYMIKAYALAFNRDVRAFWSLNSGNFGGGTEAALQSEKATYTGAAEFILATQEQIQWLLPDSLIFEYEVDDTRGKFQKAEIDALLIESAKGLAEVGLEAGMVQQWLAERGVIPSEWTAEIETEVAENGILKERYLELERVQAALDRFPDEPVVMYESPSVAHPTGKVVRLWKNKEDAIGKSFHVNRQTDIEDYEPDQTSRGNFMYLAALQRFLEQFDELDEDELEILDRTNELLASSEVSNQDINELDSDASAFIPLAVLAALLLLRDKSTGALADMELLHPGRWNTRLKYFENLGKLYGADEETRFTWYFGDTKHCSDCAELDGVTKTAFEWLEDGRVPQGSMLECKGFHCQCNLVQQ